MHFSLLPSYLICRHGCIFEINCWEQAGDAAPEQQVLMHCAHLKRGPKIFKKGTKRGPDFEQKGDLKGTKRGPKRGPKNRGFKISKKAYMLKFSTKKSNLPSKFIERVHFHFHSPSTIQSNSDKHMYLDTAGYFHTICQMVHKG